MLEAFNKKYQTRNHEEFEIDHGRKQQNFIKLY